MTKKEILVAAKNLIVKEENWCRFTESKDCLGDVCLATDPLACRWCASGAIVAIAEVDINDMESFDLSDAAMNELSKYTYTECRQGIISYNDSHTHEQVIAVFDKAIKGLILEELENE